MGLMPETDNIPDSVLETIAEEHGLDLDEVQLVVESAEGSWPAEDGLDEESEPAEQGQAS